MSNVFKQIRNRQREAASTATAQIVHLKKNETRIATDQLNATRREARLAEIARRHAEQKRSFSWW